MHHPRRRIRHPPLSRNHLYKTTDYWFPEHERCIRWDDSVLAIDWSSTMSQPLVSAKDAQGAPFDAAEVFV